MTIRKIETPLYSNREFDGLLDAASLMAGQFGAEVDVCFIQPLASNAVLYDAGFGFANPQLITQIQTEEAAAADTAQQRFEAWMEHHGGGVPIRWRVEDGPVGNVVAQRGCLADLVLFQRRGDKGPALDEAFEGAVLGAGRLAMVTDGALSDDYLDHVMVAWNHSTEASHAITLAMPFLKEARRVSVFAVDENGEPSRDIPDLMNYLALHGVKAEAAWLGTDKQVVGDCLRGCIEESGVTLLVMGAYTTGRARQMLFGGITQKVLTEPGVPALLAH
jgi:nucleotide-binding universal stress UspA family protein